jgi:amino acid adenylation domain-containing protein
VIGPQNTLLWLNTDATGTAQEQSQMIESLLEQERKHPFNVEHGPLLRLQLIACARDRYLLLITLPALCADGRSLKNLVDETIEVYRVLIESDGVVRRVEETESRTQYLQYSELQHQLRHGVNAEKGKAFWQRLTNLDGQLELPGQLTGVRPSGVPYSTLRQVVKPKVAAAIADIATRYEVSTELVVLASWLIYLWRLTAKPDFVINVLFDGRKYDELRDAVGPFAQFLPLRCELDEGVSLKTLLQKLRSDLPDSAARFEYFYDAEAVEAEPAGVSSSVGFEYHELPLSQSVGGVDFSVAAWHVDLEQFPLKLSCQVDGESLRTDLQYDPQSFALAHVERLAEEFQALLESGLSNPEANIATLNLLGANERNELLAQFGSQACTYAVQKNLSQLFEEQAERTPEAVALVFDEARVTYGELNARANRLAHHLQSLGVGPEVIVGICTERSLEMVVAVLGVLKAGGGYLPLDPSYPRDRLAFMIEDSAIPLLITQHRQLNALPSHKAQVVCIDSDWEIIANGSAAHLETNVDPDHVAYVIYTSGSTGKPKGVLISHANVTRLFSATDDWYHFNERDVWTLFHSYAFDFSVWELWGALLYGGKLVIVPYVVSRSPEAFYELLSRERVTVLNQTPSAFRQLIHAEKLWQDALTLHLRLVIFGGEALEPQTLKPWFERHGDKEPQLVNMYGITETTVHVTYRPLTSADATDSSGSQIGGPIPDLQVYVLGEDLQLLPRSVPGELYVGGAGLARNYLKRPELTAERFVPNFFSDRPGERLYKTGDLVCYGEGGEIAYLGRVDQQVKIKGFRIELGEIESVLMGHESVREAVVVAREDEPGEKRLVAYVVPEGEGPSTDTELRTYLQERLPDYMMPALFIVLESLPLTPSGKINRRALPVPEQRSGSNYVAPRTNAEEILTSIWSEVLPVRRVGVYDNFFALGGDSIRSVRVLALARERGLTFTLQDIFKHQTIAELARSAGRNGTGSGKLRIQPFMLVAEEDRPKLPPGLEDAYPLSRMQLGMLYHMELQPESPSYHNVASYQVRGKLDPKLLQEAVQRVVARHPILRTSFDLMNFSEPLQLVHSTAETSIPIFDLRELSVAEQEREILEFVEGQWQQLFDLAQPPLLRFYIHRRTDDTFQITATECHAIFDGWSLTSTFAELFSTHFELIENREAIHRPPPAVLFRDYIFNERRALESEECREYWTEKLQDVTPLQLSRWKAHGPREQGMRVRKIPVPITPEMSDALRQLANHLAMPVKSVMLAAHVKVLSVITGESDILTGLAGNGRPEEIDAEDVRGLYVLTSPLRLKLNSGTWADLIRECFQAELELLPYRLFPISEVQKIAALQPLLETEFHYLHFHSVADLLNSGEIEILGNLDRSETNFTLLVGCQMNPLTSELTLDLQCDMNLLSDQQVDALAGYYERVLQSMITAPLENHAVTLLSDSERQQVLEWSGTKRELPEQSIHEVFAEQAARTPEAVALVFGEEQVSYGELNERANQLAHYLRQQGVGPEALVGVMLERSVDLVVSLLGILKAGGVYVPLDAEYPAERLSFMIEDAGLQVLLTNERLSTVVPKLDRKVVCLDRERAVIGAQSTANPELKSHPEDLAYVIYTSGSTGNPKGVTVPHRAVIRLVKETDYLRFGEDEVFLQLAPVSFDASTLELWGSLLNGARLVIMPAESPTWAELGTALREYRVTTLWLTAGLFHLMVDERLDDLSGVMQLLAGGDVLSSSHVQRYLDATSGGVLINGYGPTENTTFSTTYCMDAGSQLASSSVPIGRPITNTEAYVLDQQQELVPVGVAGELHLGGAGLARAYLGRPELTAEKFVPHPYSHDGARLYRTGDQVRWLADGTLEFLGRWDQQVKLRGFRVELGEIESALNEHEAVQESVVVAQEDEPGERRLVAYVVTASDDPNFNGSELRSYLRERLPEYMVPSAFVPLEQLPLTPNGKVDRRALPAPEQDGSSALLEYVAPRTQTEELLCQLWAGVLKAERVGITDNFFELGGHSLLATQLVSRVREIFQVDLPLRRLFELPTVSDLAAALQEINSAGPTFHLPVIEVINREQSLPLSFAQQRLWFLDQLNPGSSAYNVPLAIRLSGQLDLFALEQSVNAILQRHESLRTTFAEVNAKPVQVIHEPSAITIPLTDLSSLAETDREREAGRLVNDAAMRPFDLQQGPLLRIELTRLADQEHILLATMHHIVGDAWSLSVLIDEFVAHYSAFCHGQEVELPPPAIQYADYAAWQREWLQGEVFEQQIDYWRKQLDGPLPALNLPADHPRPQFQTHRGASCELELSAETSKQLHELSRREGATLFMTLVTALNLLLARYTGQEDIIIGTPVAGRNRLETEGLIGFFVNTLVLRASVTNDPTFRELLKQVRKVTLGAYAHQDLPFEKLVDELQPERDLSRLPLFEVVFALQHVADEEVELPGLRLTRFELKDVTAKFDLMIVMESSKDSLTGSIEYNRDLFEPSTIQRMSKHFANLLDSIVADPNERFSQLKVLSNEEQLVLEQPILIPEFDSDFSFS